MQLTILIINFRYLLINFLGYKAVEFQSCFQGVLCICKETPEQSCEMEAWTTTKSVGL